MFLTHVPRRPAALGAMAPGLIVSLAVAGPLPMATGPDPSAEGYLLISADEYGSWASLGFPAHGTDVFHPVGLPVMTGTFTNGFMLFVPARAQRELLSDSSLWQTGFSADLDTTLDRTILTPNAASDSSGDGVDDTLTSVFRVTGTDTDLHFEVTQRIEMVTPGYASLRQTYTITNDSSMPIDFNLLRLFDGDFMWSGDADDDEVGTLANGTPGRSVFMQDAGLPRTRVTLLSFQAGDYVGAKQDITPPGGPPFDFGTDDDEWLAFGIPTNWRNHVANVGTATDGISGPAPGRDVHMDLDFELALAPGDSQTIELLSQYGQPVVAPGAPGVCYATTGFAGGAGGDLLTIDPVTGAGTLVGPTGLPAVPGLAINSMGEIYATQVDAPATSTISNLYRIDGNTGTALFIASTGLSNVDALAFDKNDVLYAVTTPANDLFTIAPGTGVPTFVGSIGADIRDLAVDPTDGSLWGSTGGPASGGLIYRINKATGAATLVGDTGLGLALPAIHFDSFGNLFGAGVLAGGGGGGGAPSTLIAIDKATGAGTPIGPIGFSSVAAMTFLVSTAQIPTVGEWGLIVLTLLLLCAGTIIIRRELARRVMA